MEAKLIYLIYRALEWAASPFILLYFVFRALKDHRYLRCFPERLGFLPPALKRETAESIWLHAVSVGEVLSTMELLRRLRAELPSASLFVSTTTLAGRALADQKLEGLADGVFYAPIDFCFAVRRVLRTLRPAVVVVAETEIWPNLYREAKRAGCGLAVVNGRISDRAEPRYLRFKWFFGAVLRWPDRILAQSEGNRQRYLALGVPPERVSDGGNLKYDFRPSPAGIPECVREFVARAAPLEIWIAASTMPPAEAGDVDEDDAVIEAFRLLGLNHPRLLLILAPRKPERFDAAAAKLEAAGISYVRRSLLDAESPQVALPGVLLLDSMGELSSLFALDSVVFMGGSLARRGGHNVLEAASYSRAVVVGPHMENFAEIAAEFQAGDGWLKIGGPAGLADAIERLLQDTAFRQALGQSAQRLADAKGGATARAACAIVELYSAALPRRSVTAAAFPFLWLLSRVWRLGSDWKQRRGLARRGRLRTPVVSVGNLSMGGSGKTPFALWLAQRLRERGSRAAILTRGYRRSAPETTTAFDAGASVPVALTGDEAQIFLRSGVAPVGIGKDRSAAGRAVEEKFRPDVLILDDGFQHWRLARDLDIVLVDALDPFGGGELFPLGRLREPLGALSRAGAFVITRTEPRRRYTGIESRLREFNPAAPIFRARVTPEYWVDCETGERLGLGDLRPRRVAAFCGLANPTSFWRTLASLDFHPVSRRSMGDHHRYRPFELKRLAAEARSLGAEALLTTEKDFMNLSADAGKLVSPMRLYWLKIGIEVEEQERLLELVETSRLCAPQ